VLRVVNATGNNLKGVTVDVPVGLLTCVTGVSGSGKSTLVNDTLYAAAAQPHPPRADEPAAHEDPSRAWSTSTRSSTSTSPPSAARRAATRPPTPACSPPSAN
jgi:excinuclease UvrABC ATPase subunit